jgi:hypothetical protein
MADEFGGIGAILGFAAIWVGVFFGIWAIPPLSEATRWFVDEAVTILIPAFAIMYFDYKGKIPIGKETRKKIWFGISCGMLLFISFTTFIMTAGTWEYVEIDGHQIMTYEDMASLSFSVIGVITIIYVAHMIRNRDKFLKKLNNP